MSAWAVPGTSGRILRHPDTLGNRVLDYSTVGYKGGMVPIPNVPVKLSISPVAGDDGPSIQAAINQVQSLPLDANGFRGAVFLNAGEYDIAGSVTISASGVVLRGAGDGAGGTVLRASGAGQRSLVRVAGSGSASTVSGTTRNIADWYVPVGARSFTVDSTSGLAVDDRVLIRRTATDQWIEDLGMDLLCCPPDVNPWTASGYHLDYDRTITRIEGSRITLDAGIPCAIEARYAGGTLRKYTWAGRIQNVGVEDIRGVSDYDPSVTSTTGASPAYAADEDHGWVFVQMNAVENAWVRRVTSVNFGYACVALYSGTKNATVQDCRSLDPVSIITGGRRYAFVMDDCSSCLVQSCYNSKDRHQYVTQSQTMGPNVFVDGLSDTAYSDAGPHHRWATGAIWDNVTVNGNNINVQNRGNSGSGHGWAGANELVWNSRASGGFIVQNPPGARNWLIGSIGTIRTGTMWVGPHDPGTYDAHGSHVYPNSLYYAQLQDRLAAPGLDSREYWLGDLDSFATGSATGEVVAVDATWRSAVLAIAGALPVRGFDIVSSNQFAAFTFNYTLAPGERVVSGSISLAMRGAGSGAGNDVLYVDSTATAHSFAGLGWLPVGTGSNTTVRVLDLAPWLDSLTDGRLNLALGNDTGVDWAMLELQVAPAVGGVTNVILPAADTYVRAGGYAGNNFGSAPTLEVKSDSSADVRREAFLRWDLTGVSGEVLHARIRLTPLSVGTNGLEHGATICTADNWAETSLTWNSRPGNGKRFATWIPSQSGVVEFVVTPYLQAALAGGRQLSLHLYSLTDVGAPGLVAYASREHADPASRPQLILLVTNTPASGNWIVDASGRWNHGSNWAGGLIANGTGSIATFALDVTANREVNLDAPGTLGGLRFADSGMASPGDWNITNQILTLQVPTGTPVVAVTNRTAVLGSIIDGSQGLNKLGDGTLVLAGANVYAGQTSIGEGALRVTHNAALGSGANGTTVGNTASARLELFGGVLVAEPLTVSCKGSALGNVPVIVNSGGTNTLLAPISLTTGGSYWTFEASTGHLMVSGSVSNITTSNVRTIWLRGAAIGEWRSSISDSAAGLGTAIRKDDTGAWLLSGTNRYTGNTTVSNGVLEVNGVIAGGEVFVPGGTLTGTGLISAPVNIQAGGALAPGRGRGVLTISNSLTLAAGSTTYVEVNAHDLASDLVRGLGNLAYGGTLVVSNAAGNLQAGQSFVLFAAGNPSGNFASLTPPPGPGLQWNFNPATGVLTVLGLPRPEVTHYVVGADGVFSMSGSGPVGEQYRVLASTNITLPAGLWTEVDSGVFVGGKFRFSDVQSANQPQRFYRLSLP